MVWGVGGVITIFRDVLSTIGQYIQYTFGIFLKTNVKGPYFKRVASNNSQVQPDSFQKVRQDQKDKLFFTKSYFSETI